MLILLQLGVALLAILIAAELFTNALEHLGERIGISEGVTGSLLAAAGTALPETLIPLLALLAGTANTEVNQEIGVGAILGAPLMLSTLSLSQLALAVFKQRGWKGNFTPEPTGISRDLNIFLLAFMLAVGALYLKYEPARMLIAVTLIALYIAHLFLTIRASKQLVSEGHGTEAEEELMLARLGLPENMLVISLQLAIGLGLMLAGAKLFIIGVEAGAKLLGISVLLLSLLIIPIATELPEKINSIIWVRRRKDTLAFGNITGALALQGTLLPAIGIALTSWEPRPEVVAGVILTLIGTAWLRICLARGQVQVWQLGINGTLYLIYLALSLA